LDDVVVLDPSDVAPVGLNPLHTAGRRPEVVADGILSVLKRLYGKAVGPRSSDILYASLLTLAQRGDASLVMLPLLLTNPGIRRSLTKDLRDPLVLQPFWAGFERWSDAERAAAVAPVLNKLRPLLRPGLRGVLGQRSPRFTLDQVFKQPTILLVPLQRGVIGTDAANLLGSILVSQLWSAIQGQGAVPASQRRPVMVTIDEAPNFVDGSDLADALAMARGFSVSYSLGAQFVGQFPRETRAAVLANARSRVVFQTAHDDAKILERSHPELTAADLTALAQYELYASLFARGQVQPYASGRSRPLPPAISRPSAVMARSRARYGQPLDRIEADFASLLTPNPGDAGTTNRRRRTP
ncbi:MAG: Type secretory system Conjugative transfer, partial [Bacteroidetes bacterium]|nr:Type secretory system Conjugative transfer [Bacteroidota bacterium]